MRLKNIRCLVDVLWVRTDPAKGSAELHPGILSMKVLISYFHPFELFILSYFHIFSDLCFLVMCWYPKKKEMILDSLLDSPQKKLERPMALTIIAINQRTTSTLIFTFPVGSLSLFCAFYLAALFDQTTRSIADPPPAPYSCFILYLLCSRPSLPLQPLH